MRDTKRMRRSLVWIHGRLASDPRQAPIQQGVLRQRFRYLGVGAEERAIDSVAVLAVAVTTATATTALTRLGLVDLQVTAFEVLAVQRLHGLSSIGIRHLDEAEATGAAGFTIVDEGERLDRAMRRKQRTH